MVAMLCQEGGRARFIAVIPGDQRHQIEHGRRDHSEEVATVTGHHRQFGLGMGGGPVPAQQCQRRRDGMEEAQRDGAGRTPAPRTVAELALNQGNQLGDLAQIRVAAGAQDARPTEHPHRACDQHRVGVVVACPRRMQVQPVVNHQFDHLVEVEIPLARVLRLNDGGGVAQPRQALSLLLWRMPQRRSDQAVAVKAVDRAAAKILFQCRPFVGITR